MKIISYRLGKYATSSGSNYEEAQAAVSRIDFGYKVNISLKEMREKFNPFIRFRATRPDSYRDVPAAATKSIGLAADPAFGEGRHTGVMVFANPSRLFLRDPKLAILTRTWYLGTISSCTRTFQPSPGPDSYRDCKNHATATQTPTNQTAGPSDCLKTYCIC